MVEHMTSNQASKYTKSLSYFELFFNLFPILEIQTGGNDLQDAS